MPEGRDPRRSVYAALVADALITVCKAVAAFVSGSTAMLAESLHSLADTGNQAFLLLGLRRAERPADEEHQFGHGNERFFWAFLVAMCLFTLGAAFSIYEGVTRLTSRHHQH